mmetsp:Transcript_18820/g.61811  ORF Transcript_18820/g.61811 Transcript_18820/m.61811 type:complete len:245 (-) Transcript_18820:609-1343(-)
MTLEALRLLGGDLVQADGPVQGGGQDGVERADVGAVSDVVLVLLEDQRVQLLDSRYAQEPRRLFDHRHLPLLVSHSQQVLVALSLVLLPLPLAYVERGTAQGDHALRQLDGVNAVEALDVDDDELPRGRADSQSSLRQARHVEPSHLAAAGRPCLALGVRDDEGSDEPAAAAAPGLDGAVLAAGDISLQLLEVSDTQYHVAVMVLCRTLLVLLWVIKDLELQPIMELFATLEGFGEHVVRELFP